jgi:superfamily II helicase
VIYSVYQTQSVKEVHQDERKMKRKMRKERRKDVKIMMSFLMCESDDRTATCEQPSYSAV